MQIESKGPRKWVRSLRTGFTLAAGAWLVVVATLLAIASTSDFHLSIWTVLYLVLTILASPICFMAYWIDRRRAAKDLPRVSWQMLQLPAMLGGWPGAVLGRSVCRREGDSFLFRVMLWLIIALHLAAMGYMFYRRFLQPDSGSQ